MNKITILHLEDNTTDAHLVSATLKRAEIACDIILVSTKDTFAAALKNEKFDIILADYGLPDYNGLEALKISKKELPDVPFILLSGTIGEEKTIELFKFGVTDFIIKNNLQRLAPSIIRALKEVDEINKVKLAEQALTNNVKLFHQFMENVPEVFWQTTLNFDKTIYLSPAFEKIWGISIDEGYKNPLAWFDPIFPEDQARVKDAFNQILLGNASSAEVEYKIKRSDGYVRTIMSRGSVLKENGKAIGLIGVATDMTEQQKIREKLRSSVKEKDVLLKEIYHRVKNNLQVVSSILNLQARKIKDPASIAVFLESSSRIQSMALAHETLYQSDSLDKIQMSQYLQKLIVHLTNVYHVDASKIKLLLDANSVLLSLELAIPCGLIINELIANAIKHAFPNGKNGQVCISMRCVNKEIVLRVADDGIGMSTQLDVNNLSTLGLQLTHALAKQLDATVAIDGTNGTAVTITFATPFCHAE